jgi:prevent-host-death family protein
MKHRVVNVTEFKAKCLALLDDVGTRGGTITITKRGRPLARVSPAHQSPWKSPEGSWTGKVTIVGDLADETSGVWNAVRPRRGARD